MSESDHIPFNRVSWLGNEFAYIAEAVKAGHISGVGRFTKLAESYISDQLGSSNLLTTSCTHALEMAALLLRDGIDDRDEVIVPSFTFVSTASAFAINGFRVRFADVNAEDLNIDSESVASLINERTRAICVVNYAGRAANFDRIREMAKGREIAIVEDNAHGFGGSVGERRLGTLGDISTHSFHETKNVSCGEGGNIVLNDARYFERAEILREKGTNRTKFLRGQVDKYTWVDIGSSWVLSEILAAVLFAQLERFTTITENRMRVYSRYTNSLKDWAEENLVGVPPDRSDVSHTAHLFYLKMPSLAIRSRFINHLRANNINAVFHYQALNTSPVGLALGGAIGQCPNSETASNTLVRLPIYETLSETEVERVISAVISFAADSSIK